MVTRNIHIIVQTISMECTMTSYCMMRALKTLLRSEESILPLLQNKRFSSTISQPVNKLGEKFNLPVPENDIKIGTKLLKIAIIGTPNAGKSTLINQIVGRRIFAMSKKVHTTKSRARAVHIEGNTQLVFLDTPGLVSASESQKYKLSQKFLSDGEDSMVEADVIGVVHDVSNSYTRNSLDPKVLRLLHLHQEKESFLVLNKIDTLKSKRILLNLSKALTGSQLRSYKEPIEDCKLSEGAVLEIIKKESHWEKFSDVFMVSALLGKGTSDLKSYLLNAAQPGKWLFGPDIFTDQEPVQIIEEAVRSKMLDHLPNEIPYNIDIELEYLDMAMGSDEMVAVVLVYCSNPRIEKLIVGNGGHRIKLIARETELALIDTFMKNVRLRLIVKSNNPD